jgi:hypothetical protein
LQYLNWTCISTEECSSLGSDWEGEGPGAGRFKIHRLPGDMGQCVFDCPADYQVGVEPGMRVSSTVLEN